MSDREMVPCEPFFPTDVIENQGFFLCVDHRRRGILCGQILFVLMLVLRMVLSAHLKGDKGARMPSREERCVLLQRLDMRKHNWRLS